MWEQVFGIGMQGQPASSTLEQLRLRDLLKGLLVIWLPCYRIQTHNLPDMGKDSKPTGSKWIQGQPLAGADLTPLWEQWARSLTYPRSTLREYAPKAGDEEKNKSGPVVSWFDASGDHVESSLQPLIWHMSTGSPEVPVDAPGRSYWSKMPSYHLGTQEWLSYCTVDHITWPEWLWTFCSLHCYKN